MKKDLNGKRYRESDGTGSVFFMFMMGIGGLLVGLAVSYYFQPASIRTPSVYEYCVEVIPQCLQDTESLRNQKILITAGIITVVCGVMVCAMATPEVPAIKAPARMMNFMRFSPCP